MNIAATNTTPTATFSLITGRTSPSEESDSEYPHYIVTKRPDTGSRTADAILLAAHRIRTSADRALRDLGLSLASYKALRELDGADLQMRELSDVLHVSPRTVTDLVDGLEARGLVGRIPHLHDRRVTLIRLTEAGREQLAKGRAVAAAAREALLVDLGPEERDELVRLLERVGAGS